MADPTYTLQELSDASGIEARTIRSYIERDLLPGPSGMGPKASYGPEHRDRLEVIRRLRDAHRGITLDQIRGFLTQLAPEQIAAIAAGELRLEDAGLGAQATLTPSSSALSYLRSIGTPKEVARLEEPSARRMYSQSPARSTSPSPARRTPFEELLEVLVDAMASGSVSRSVRSETWHRVPITPDIELSVRGELDTDQLALVQRIGDHLRHLLMKGVKK